MGQEGLRDGVQHGPDGDFQSGLGKPCNGLKTQLTDDEEREVGNTMSDAMARLISRCYCRMPLRHMRCLPMRPSRVRS